jgi:hypothetical protein
MAIPALSSFFPALTPSLITSTAAFTGMSKRSFRSLLPPFFSSSRMPVIITPLSMGLSMS